MRWVAWCAACSLLACGQSHGGAGTRDSNSRGGQSAAGSAGLTERGGSSGTDPEGGSPGRGGDTLGSSAGAGGAAGMDGGRGSTAGAAGTLIGGSAGSGGFAGASLAGMGGMPPNAGASGATGNGGAAGAAGAPVALCEEYVACGCGCCGGDTTPTLTCFYPDRGDTLERIMADDEALAMDPTCANSGCAKGTRYVCCVPPSDERASTYRTDTSHSDASDRIVLIAADADDNCVAFALSSTLEPPKVPIEVPAGWHMEVASTGFTCSSIYNFPQQRIAMGGEGFVRFTAPDQCAIDFDVTLYFYVGVDEVEATRLVGHGVPTPNVGTGCN